MRITAILDHKLRVARDELPADLRSHLVDALTIPNLAKREAEKQHQWGWEQMPDKIALYSLDGDHMVMPRGFSADFADGMYLSGHDVEWTDNRYFPTMPEIGEHPDLRPWQIPAWAAMRQFQQGIYKAPAGSGKTVTMLGLIQTLATPSLVIVNTKDILWQWQKRAREFLGADYPVGQIGDGIFEVSDYLTIATAQTLHSRFDNLEAAGFFDDEFGLVCLDECHHATADTYNRVLDRFSARYRLGVSATPDKTGDFALATRVLGPIIHETKPADVTTLMHPEVIRVPTKFGYGFRGTKSRWQRSNYPQMIDALIRDRDRNMLIVDNVLANEGHHQLLVSKRLEHLTILEDMILEAGFLDPVHTLTGQDDNESRQAAKELAETRPCIILSTLADEAMDIPRLDRLHLPYPQKNTGLVTQQVGRVERIHPDKHDAKIYDYTDMNVGPLERQWRGRRFEVYEPRGYKITVQKAAKA